MKEHAIARSISATHAAIGAVGTEVPIAADEASVRTETALVSA